MYWFSAQAGHCYPRLTSLPLDGEIFRLVLESKYKLVPRTDAVNYTIVTSDKELRKYC